MFGKSLIVLAAIPILLLDLFPGAGQPSAPPSASLIAQIENWLDENTSLTRAPDRANVRIVSPDRVPASTGTASAIGTHTRGLYDPETTTIQLVHPWSANNPEDVSVLLHELVHHRQFAAPVRCRGAMEQAAYAHQQKWLGERGLGLNINRVALSLGANCRLRDIHPD